MYTDDDIESAVQTGILTDDNAVAFREHVSERRGAPIVDDEHFRFITGFNDIFVVIACLLSLVSLAWIGADTVDGWVGGLLCVVAAWGLAEFFTRKRRMALPSIVLLVGFVGAVVATAGMLLNTEPLMSHIVAMTPENQSADVHDFIFCLSAGAGAIAALLHWLRFKVPITVAAGTAAAVTFIVLLLFVAVPEATLWMNTVMFCAGIAVFALALRWDASDPSRRTRRSDVAFWLHLLAAPLLVHPIFSYLDVFGLHAGPWQAIVMIAVYAIIALISISIDRRALMASALIYVLYPLNELLNMYGIVSLGFALTGAIVGSGLLLLSAFWHECRRRVVELQPNSIRVLLPPIRSI